MEHKKMKNYFITGMPRSRTAWLANMMTYGPSFCYHEALMWCDLVPERLPELFDRNGSEYVGTSCSGILLIPDLIKRLFPEAKHVIIYRRESEVEAELSKIFCANNMAGVMDKLWSALQHYKEVHPDSMMVTFEELDRQDTCEAIWSHCVTGIPFHVERWKMLADMDIQLSESAMDKRRGLVWH